MTSIPSYCYNAHRSLTWGRPGFDGIAIPYWLQAELKALVKRLQPTTANDNIVVAANDNAAAVALAA